MIDRILTDNHIRFMFSPDGKDQVWFDDNSDLQIVVEEDETMLFFRGTTEVKRLSNNEYNVDPLNETNIYQTLIEQGIC